MTARLALRLLRRKPSAIPNRLPRHLNGYQLIWCEDEAIHRLAPVVHTQREIPPR